MALFSSSKHQARCVLKVPASFIRSLVFQIFIEQLFCGHACAEHEECTANNMIKASALIEAENVEGCKKVNVELGECRVEASSDKANLRR